MTYSLQAHEGELSREGERSSSCSIRIHASEFFGLCTQFGFMEDLFQASLKISEDSRVRAERNQLDRTSIPHAQGTSGNPVSAAFTHGQFVWFATKLLLHVQNNRDFAVMPVDFWLQPMRALIMSLSTL
jgi:hypothetical protein